MSVNKVIADFLGEMLGDDPDLYMEDAKELTERLHAYLRCPPEGTIEEGFEHGPSGWEFKHPQDGWNDMLNASFGIGMTDKSY